jgi:hypothetical protein
MTIGLRRIAICCACALWATGCSVLNRAPSLPAHNNVVLGQLWIYSDVYLPQRHRLFEELNAQRGVLATKLDLPTSDEPVYVYLFNTNEDFKRYVNANYPSLPSRRAFFLENDTRLMVYAFWGDRVAEDLRHEVAHGYLHSIVPRIPLWVDEGLAEYFEVPAGHHGINRPHVQELATARQNSGWRPDLRRLERLAVAADMTQLDYAESWAWVHLMLETTPDRQQALHAYLASIGQPGEPEPLSTKLRGINLDYEQKLLEHLDALERKPSNDAGDTTAGPQKLAENPSK